MTASMEDLVRYCVQEIAHDGDLGKSYVGNKFRAPFILVRWSPARFTHVLHRVFASAVTFSSRVIPGHRSARRSK